MGTHVQYIIHGHMWCFESSQNLHEPQESALSEIETLNDHILQIAHEVHMIFYDILNKIKKIQNATLSLLCLSILSFP